MILFNGSYFCQKGLHIKSSKPRKMKKQLLFSLIISIAIQVDAQTFFELESQHEEFTEAAELQRKNKILTNRDTYKRDSMYRYDDIEDNLQRKWIYYDYNFANNYASYHDFDYEGNNEWSPNFIRNREFNTDGSVSSYASLRYVNSVWINSSRAMYEYNESGYETLENRETWDEDTQQWGPFIRFERFYNSDNTILTLNFYNTDFTTGLLDLAYIRTYTNIDNVITEWLTEYYDDGVIYERRKTEVFLDAENERDSTYTYEWDNITSTWNLSSRYIYPEDINASIRNYYTDEYNAVTNAWDPLFLSVFTEYADIGETQYWDRFRSDQDETDYYLDSRLEYFWSNNPLDTEEPTENDIDIILPNPFEGNPQITLKGLNGNATFTIHDVRGNKLFEKEINQSNSFNLDRTLPNGIYFINLIQADKVIGSKKIVKMR